MKKICLAAALILTNTCGFIFGQTQTFNFTGATVNYVVPAGVTGICYTVCGGQGMGNVVNNMGGGLGGRVMGVLSVVPGQVLQINVGNGGIAQNAGGFNGGARGGTVIPNASANPVTCLTSQGGGGGGASDIRVAPYGLADRVAVGAGGGGTGGQRVQNCGPGCGGGGGGGWYGGGGGGAYGGSPGFGGTQIAGGNGGASCCGCPLLPQPGAAGVFGGGGIGGGMTGGNMQFGPNPGCAGGIGGGLVGGQGPNCTGGTGCGSTWAGASGAGGSSYGIAASTPTIAAGVQAGNGFVTINPNCCAAPSLTATATPSNICPGQTTTLTVIGAGVGGTYTWMPGNLSGSNVAVSPLATTIYTVAGATAASSCAGTQTVAVNINPLPVIVANNPTACANTNILLTANGGTAYVWSGPLAYVSAIQNPTIANATPPMSGNYTVIGTSALGCTNTAVASVTVLPLPNVTVIGNNTLCSQNFNGSINTLSLTAMGGSSYGWSLPLGYNAFPNTSAPTITLTPPIVSVPTIASLSVTGTGAFGCTNIAVYDVTVVPNPTVVVAPLTPTMCFGTSVSLTASGAFTYGWAQGSTLNTTTGSVVVASPTANTTYTVIGSALTCNSDNGLVTVQVTPNPNVFITSSTPTVCAGSSINLTGNGASIYQWSPAATLNNASLQMVTATPIVTTEYTVVGTLNSCTTAAIVQVTIIPLPTLQASVNKSTICFGEVANINANGAINYNWTPVVGLDNPNSNFVVASPTVSTIYTLVGSNGLCFGSATVEILVAPRPELFLTTSQNQLCEGNSATIFAAGSQSYIWSPMSSINLINPTTASVNPQTSTNYTVTAYNTAGTLQCNVTRQIQIDVLPKIVPTISSSVAICEGESVKLNAGGSNSFVWNPQASLNDAYTASPYAKPKVTTVYQVIVSNSGNCPVSATVLVKVNPTPTVDAGPDVTYNLDEPMYLNAKGSGTLRWILGEGILCKDCPNSQIMPTNSGCYQIQATNELGCKTIDEVCIDVSKDYNIYIPNIFTPNADGKNDVFLVFGTGFTKLEVTVFDRWGEKLFTSTDQLKGWDGKYKGVDLKEDVYPYQVIFTSLDGKKHTKTGHVTLLK